MSRFPNLEYLSDDTWDKRLILYSSTIYDLASKKMPDFVCQYGTPQWGATIAGMEGNAKFFYTPMLDATEVVNRIFKT